MSLSSFLLKSKTDYLAAVRNGNGRDWTVVMGNEAGDLDSVASSIAYSWFLSSMKDVPSVALLQLPRGDLNLRPENIHAFKLASLSQDRMELLCIDDLPSSTPFPSNRFVLVDHNRLISRFSENNEDVKVVAVLDHHEDEGLYKDTADPRKIVVPTGSASSVVTQYIRTEISDKGEGLPRELADLLLCAILIDTDGLKMGGKAELLDHESAAYLLPRSSVTQSSVPKLVSVTSTESESVDLRSLPALQTLNTELRNKKNDISGLTTSDLLRRDYKQYAWTPSWISSAQPIHVGLSTVPMDIRDWILRDLDTSPDVSSTSFLTDFWNSIDAFMHQRGIDILGILTTFHNKKDKHRRQSLFIFNDRSAQTISELEKRVIEGLEGSETLSLKRKQADEIVSKYFSKHHKSRDHKGNKDVKRDAEEVKRRIRESEDEGSGKRKIYLYKQGNAKATRKVVAPLLKHIIEGS